MNKFIAIVKIIFNVILFLVYSFFAIIVTDFIRGFYITQIQGKNIPNYATFEQYKIAGIVIVFVFILTFLLRKFLYVEVLSEKFLEAAYKKKSGKTIKTEETLSYTEKKKLEKKVETTQQQVTKKHNEDDLEIYVNKEI